jgi:putative protease
MMVTEHCVLMAQGPCNQDCSNCKRRKALHLLEDRKRYRMPVITDNAGRSHLFNAVELDLAHTVPELMIAGVTGFMVDGSCMNNEELRAACTRARRAVDLAKRGAGSLPKKEGCTTGHLFRPLS